MEREISSGTTLGVVLIALAVIIALGFGVFSIAKSTANEGSDKVQSSIDQVQKSEFQDFDQKVVSGTKVLAAYSNFEGRPVAIVIKNSAASTAVNYNALLTGSLTMQENGYYLCSGSFETKDNELQFNMNTGDLKKSGNDNYIVPTAKYNAYLIKDKSGTIVGVSFKQVQSGN